MIDFKTVMYLTCDYKDCDYMRSFKVHSDRGMDCKDIAIERGWHFEFNQGTDMEECLCPRHAPED